MDVGGEGQKKEPVKSLLDAIDEEVAGAGFSVPPGAKPIEAQVAKKRAEPMRDMIVRVARKPRTLALLLLLLAVVVELAFVQWSTDASESLAEQRAKTIAQEAARAAAKADAKGPGGASPPASAAPAAGAPPAVESAPTEVTTAAPAAPSTP